MLKNRVIPVLLLENGRLVKTFKFQMPRYVGDPINAIHIFNEKEVDELVVLDISASKEGYEPNFELLEQLAGECFMPLTYGGGINNLEQANRIFSLGIEKVCIQTGCLDDTALITRLADRFGSQSIVVSVDIKRDWLGNPRLYSASRGKIVKKGWLEHIKSLIVAGAGEIILNSIDRDGTLLGPDIELIGIVSKQIRIPLVALGGIGSLADIKLAVDAGANAVAAGSFFVFHGPHRAVLITYPRYQDLEELFAA